MKNWNPKREFKHCKRYLDVWYPGLVNDEDVDDDDADEIMSAEPVQPAKLIPMAKMRMITEDDYKTYVFPVVPEKPTTYIAPFHGFAPDAAFTIPDLLDRIPTNTGEKLAVFGDYIFVLSTDEKMHFTRIGELDNGQYPVTRIYDRTWLICDYRGNLYEVVV